MVYKEKDAQLEDNRSTAYTFLGVGIAGLIFVILFALDIIKLPMADYMRVIMIVVMSVLFVIFLGIGITHFRKINQMSADADMESRPAKLWNGSLQTILQKKSTMSVVLTASLPWSSVTLSVPTKLPHFFMLNLPVCRRIMKNIS